jgi:hypothetical protein
LFKTIRGGSVAVEGFGSMYKQITLVFATLALSTVAFAQGGRQTDFFYQVGYAANLNIGDQHL